MPKVFISYSYDNDEHKSWVYDFAYKLRDNGVDVIFDQFETRLGSDLPLFMEQGLSKSNRVICICSDLYNQKANSGKLGVGYEKRIICQEILKDSSTAWVIPLIRNNNSKDKLPIFLSSLRYISFEDSDRYNEKFYDLLRDLHDQNNLPPVGKNPFEHNQDVVGKVDEIITIRRSLACCVNTSGKVRFNYLSNSKKFTFGSGVYEFITGWSSRGGNSIYAYSDYVKAIAWSSKDIDTSSIDLEAFDFSSRTRSVEPNEYIIWVNKNGKILVTKIISIQFESSQEEWIEIEYKILENIV